MLVLGRLAGFQGGGDLQSADHAVSGGGDGVEHIVIAHDGDAHQLPAQHIPADIQLPVQRLVNIAALLDDPGDPHHAHILQSAAQHQIPQLEEAALAPVGQQGNVLALDADGLFVQQLGLGVNGVLAQQELQLFL